MPNKITVETIVNASLEQVWAKWNEPAHITKWAFASDDWEAPRAENDLRTGGKFTTRMAAKDGSAAFDFGGIYTTVEPMTVIEYDMTDTRHVAVQFTPLPNGTKVTETFDPETENSEEQQRSGWQAILDNFKKYVEGNK